MMPLFLTRKKAAGISAHDIIGPALVYTINSSPD